ncbi:hypothetical protein DPMN_143305 [Dreissena polymorpha]|uniref:Uncharacterized protein n=1 Tax=Dreissena polymorpha TaxID=45954 RepID=A0A9D4JP81_DREPO|nr:hypothetical protein DPMN_143305 [Dreissena polymorpha]
MDGRTDMSKTIYPLFFEGGGGITIKLPPPNSHVIQLTGTIFELNSRIKETNVLSKFYENWAKNVTFTVFTCFHYIHIEKNALPTGSHVFSPIPTILKLVRDINKTNVLANFHDDWAKIVTSRVFTRKTAPPTGGHVFQRIGITFELNQEIIKTNILTNFELGRDFNGRKLLTKFHEDGTRNVASRVFTSKSHLSNQDTNVLTKFHEDWATELNKTRVLTRKNAPPIGSNVLKANILIFEVIQDIIENNLLTKFHEDWTINVASRVFTRKKFPAPDIIGTNLQTKFYDDRKINVTSRVLTRKTAPPTDGHIFQHIGTTFELNEDIIKTNIFTNFEIGRAFIGAKLLTKFHEGGTRNVASRVFTSKCLRTDGHTTDKDRSEKLT